MFTMSTKRVSTASARERAAAFPPYEMLETVASGVAEADSKTRKLERLYHLTQKHSWDGPSVFAELLERHGEPGANMDPELRAALSRILTVLMWGELAAWNISADLALEIPDMDAKMAATAQVFDEARHFYVLRDYVTRLGPAPAIGGLPTRLLRKVLQAPTLAQKLVGMQLLFETNAVVMFRRIGQSEVCPILHELLPYFERDESRHVGLGVMYLPRLIERMSRFEAFGTARFQFECTMLLLTSGFTFHKDFELLGMDPRQMAERVSNMQDEIIQQMA
ncbi:MAG: ferritin-like domain-containing protein, partial [Myxococcales bacterium]|nr:ferritin-like domain-containing protein [Myxococcales bacterium]